jgi:arabinofuranan 3-O-arabinosyltransferase
VTALRITPSQSPLPTHPTLVAVDLGDGPQVRRLEDGQTTVALQPRVTDTITLSLLDWTDVIDRTALGFDQLKPPGLAEVTALGLDGTPIAAPDAAANRTRRVDLPCGQGPVIGVAGRFIQTSVSTTVGALLDGRPIPARTCDPAPIALQSGSQELLISPGPSFIADGAQLSGALAGDLTPAATSPAQVTGWNPDRRQISVPRAPVSRVLVVPESVNHGWVAHTETGARLTPVIVNGWQQGWVLPAGEQGTVTLSFPSNGLYRTGLIVGLGLLPLLALLALVPARRPARPFRPALSWRPGWLGVAGLLAAGTMIAGVGGLIVFSAGLGMGYLLQRRGRLDRWTLAVVPAGLILAGALLSRYPWRSVDGYIGHSAWVQLFALIALAALAASLLPVPKRSAADEVISRAQPPAQECR